MALDTNLLICAELEPETRKGRRAADLILSSAAEVARAHGLQFWDAVVCMASISAGAVALLTEGLQDGRRLEGLRLINPFVAANTKVVDGLLGDCGR